MSMTRFHESQLPKLGVNTYEQFGIAKIRQASPSIVGGGLMIDEEGFLILHPSFASESSNVVDSLL